MTKKLSEKNLTDIAAGSDKILESYWCVCENFISSAPNGLLKGGNCGYSWVKRTTASELDSITCPKCGSDKVKKERM